MTQPPKNWHRERVWIRRLSNKLTRLLKNKDRDKKWQATVEEVVAQMEMRILHLERPTPND